MSFGSLCNQSSRSDLELVAVAWRNTSRAAIHGVPGGVPPDHPMAVSRSSHKSLVVVLEEIATAPVNPATRLFEEPVSKGEQGLYLTFVSEY